MDRRYILAIALGISAGILMAATHYTVQSAFSPSESSSERASWENAAITQQLDQIHIPFVENLGQFGSHSLYGAHLFSGPFEVSTNGLHYGLIQGETIHTLTEQFVNSAGASLQLSPMGVAPGTTSVNYFLGAEEKHWKSNATTHHGVTLGEIYPGIQVDLHARSQNVEKLFVVSPGSDPEEIRLRVTGGEDLSIEQATGNLLVHTPHGDVAFSAPVAWEEDGTPVEVAYTILDDTYGFILGSYDRTQPLYIDPMIASTFVGGSSSDTGESVAFDSAGNLLIMSSSSSSGFPTTGGSYDTAYNSSGDIVVSKFSPDLQTLIASTFIGGNNQDVGYRLALDNSDNVFITGFTMGNFPTTPGAYDTTYGGVGFSDTFVSKLSPDLSTLLGSTYLGGSTSDIGYSITTNSLGQAVVGGSTNSTDFPVTGGPAYGGSNDGYVSILSSDLTTLIDATFIGGSSSDWVNDITVDGSDQVYVAGRTMSNNFPTSVGAYDTSYGGSFDIFVSKFAASLGTPIASTYLGGNYQDEPWGMVMDSLGNIVIVGEESGSGPPSTYPTTPGAYDTVKSGSSEVIVSKLNNSLTALQASTYMGGSDNVFERARGVVVDSNNNIYVAGQTQNVDFPVVGDGVGDGGDGAYDAFVSKFSPDLTELLGSTYIGGDSIEDVGDIALGTNGSVYVVGNTSSTSGFPTTGGVYDNSHNGNNDTFITAWEFPFAVTLNQSPSQSDPTNTDSIIYRVVFAEAIDPISFVDTDITISSGTITNGPLEVFPNNGTVFEFTVTGVDEGVHSASLAASVVESLPGASNFSSTSTDNSVTYDSTNPIVTINQGASQNDPSNSEPVIFDVVFSEPIESSSFTAGDIQITGAASPVVASPSEDTFQEVFCNILLVYTPPCYDRFYTVEVSGLQDGETITVSIPPAGVADLAGNPNDASSSTDNSITYDITNPTLAITRTESNPTNADINTFRLTFSEDIANLDINDFAPSSILGRVPNLISTIVPESVFDITYTRLQSGNRFAGARLHANGTLDTSFINPDLVQSYFLVQPDDMLIALGNFDTTQGHTYEGVARLFPDGTVDTSFINPLVNQPISAGALQPDGKILIGGSFDSVHSSTFNRMARLNSDGSLDPLFMNPQVSGLVRSIVVQPNDKLLVGGEITSVHSTPITGLTRLEADGSLDSGFSATFAHTFTPRINAIILQSDGKILVGGTFDEVNGTPMSNLARLHPDGSLDLTFADPGIVGSVSALELLSDERVLVGGDSGLQRFLTDGSTDMSFTPVTASPIFDLDIQSDGRILMAGNFFTVESVPMRRAARLHEDGTLDTSFVNPDFNNPAFSIQELNSGSILVGGTFSSMGTVYNSTVQEGSYGVEFAGGQDISDLAGNPFDHTTDITSSETYILDQTPAEYSSLYLNPEVLSTPDSYSNATSVALRLSFDEDVFNLDTGDLQLDLSGTTTGTISTVTPVSAALYDVLITAITGDGTLGVSLDSGNDVVDTSGNGSPTLLAQEIYTIDNTPSSLLFTDTVEAGPVSSDTVEITVSEEHSYFAVEYKLLGSSTCNAPNFGTGSGTVVSTITSGTYTVLTEYSEANNGQYLCLKVTDWAENETYLGSINDFNIDSTPPVISFIDDISEGPVQSDTVVVTAADSNGFSTLEYKLIASSTCHAGTYGVGTGTSFTSGDTLLTQTDDSNNGLYLCVYGEDSAGNPSYTGSAHDFHVISNGPGILFNDNVEVGPVSSDTVDLEFSDNGGGLFGGVSSFHYKFISTATCDSTSYTADGDVPSPTLVPTHTFVQSTEDHNGEYVCVEARDSIGNTTYLGSANDFHIDEVPPNVLSVLRDTPLGLHTNSSTLSFQINFSEAVDNVDSGDFVLNTFDTSSGVIDSVAMITPQSYEIDVTSVSGAGLLTVDLGIHNITDLAGNPLSTAIGLQEYYQVDDVPPTIPTVYSLTSNTGTPRIAGTYERGTTLSVEVDGSTYLFGTDPELGSDRAGNWVLDLSDLGVPLVDGVYDVVVSSTDAAGNSSTDGYLNELTISTGTPDQIIQGVLSDTTAGTTHAEHHITFTPVLPLPSNGTIVLSFGGVYNSSFADLTPTDVAVSAPDLLSYSTEIDTVNRRIHIHPITLAPLNGPIDILIGDGVVGGFNDLRNPTLHGTYGVGIDTFDGGDNELENSLAVFHVGGSAITVHAQVVDALNVILSNSAVSLNADPAINGGIATDHTEVFVSSNGDYSISALLQDSLGEAQLSFGRNSIPAGIGMNNFGLEVVLGAFNPLHIPDADITLGATPNTITSGTATNSETHTVYYDLEVNYLTVPGDYEGTVTFSVVGNW